MSANMSTSVLAVQLQVVGKGHAGPQSRACRLNCYDRSNSLKVI